MKSVPYQKVFSYQNHFSIINFRQNIYFATGLLRQKSYYGTAGNSEVNKTYKRGTFRKSHKNNYMNSTPRNACAKEQWNGNQDNSDYNKKSYFNRPNERDTTQNKPVVNNLTTLPASSPETLITAIPDMPRPLERAYIVISSVYPEFLI